jgi:RNase P subunit RPR2
MTTGKVRGMPDQKDKPICPECGANLIEVTSRLYGRRVRYWCWSCQEFKRYKKKNRYYRPGKAGE